MTTQPAPGWNRLEAIDNEMADLNAAIAEQQNILLRTKQRSEHDEAVATAAKKTIQHLENSRARLIRERSTRR